MTKQGIVSKGDWIVSFLTNDWSFMASSEPLLSEPENLPTSNYQLTPQHGSQILSFNSVLLVNYHYINYVDIKFKAKK